ncbi:MAG: hypothetical protein ACRCXT_19950 [Paraclostridium sp.]
MSKKIAYGGILLGLNCILLLLSSMIPINTMFFMGLASLPISIIIMEYGKKTGAIFYIASIFLNFIVMPNKIHWVIYVCTFGIYGLIKYIIERDRPIYIDIALKLVFANLSVIVLYMILKAIVYIPINTITIVVFQVVFILYDYGYTLFIDYYQEKLRKIIKM